MTTTETNDADQRLADLLAEPGVEEIMINGPSKGFVIRGGQKQRFDPGFVDDDALRACIRRMVEQAGRTLDERTPLVDVRLRDGSRLNAVIPPLASYTTVTIRRFVLRELAFDDLVGIKMLDPGPATFLQAVVRSGINLLICGGTSTGKTTLLGGLCSTIEPTERIVTIEETRELYLDHVLEDVCALECQFMPEQRVLIRDLVKNALRMRPNRIIVGEVRGAEALDMLQAMTTGHEGSMCTLHADSPREALFKLHTYTLMSSDSLQSGPVTEMIARSIGLVIFCRRARDGITRYVDTIFEVTGVNGGIISGQDVFVRRDGELRWTNVRPQCEARLKRHGFDLSRMFRDAGLRTSIERRTQW